MISSVVFADDWGQIMFAPAKTNIRAKRTVNSKLKGSLEAGQEVKADFLKDNWYAVFPQDHQERLEAGALGYVYAKRLENVDDVPTATTTEEMIVVKGIRVIPGTGDEETVFIALSQPAIPQLIPIQGDNTRLAIDFTNVSSVGPGLKNMDVNGKLIRRIRSHLDPQTHIFRVVLDLNREGDYTVSQKFYEAENLYTLKLSENDIKEGNL